MRISRACEVARKPKRPLRHLEALDELEELDGCLKRELVLMVGAVGLTVLLILLFA